MATPRPARQADSPAKRTAARAARANRRPAATNANPDAAQAAGSSVAPLQRGLGFTRRAIAFAVVAVVLLVSYLSTLRVYLTQQSQISAARQEITQREQRIKDLQEELNSWQDPEYVKIQARERLGWVVPGEVGYRVIDRDGKPYGGGSQIDQEGNLPAGEHPDAWWQKLWGSTRAADEPAPVPTPAQTVAPGTVKPSPPAATAGASSPR